MSGFLGSLANAATSNLPKLPSLDLSAPGDWHKTLRAASFRGVPFFVEEATNEGGRRIATHEFPLRDDPYTEDLGRAAQRFRFRAFVVGDDYMDRRDALLKACQDNATAGTLIHPYLGERKVRAGVVRWTETKREGGAAAFDLEFIQDGVQPKPAASTDTVSGLLAGLAKFLPLVKAAYATISLAIRNPGYLLGFAETIVGSFVGDLLGLPAGTIAGLQSLITGLIGNAGNDPVLANAITNLFTGAANNAALIASPLTPVSDPITGTSFTPPPSADLTGGLAQFATWGATLPAPTAPSSTQQALLAQQQVAIVTLIQASAVSAILQCYAQIDFPSADAANKALNQVLYFLDMQADLAANAGLDDLYRGWRGVTALAVADLTTRAQQLPRLATYSVQAIRPSLALAQRLYGDASRADELAELNAVTHPGFMPLAGFRLVP